MSKQRKQVTLEATLFSLMALLLLGGSIALGLLESLSKENRALIVMISSIGILGCFMGLIFLDTFRSRLRKQVWFKAMSSWKEHSQAGAAPDFQQANQLSVDSLRQLAIQTYTRIGYRVRSRQDGVVYLQLINPDGMCELFACRQQSELIKLHHIYSLELEMKRTKAVRGFFWAPAGFTKEAIAWAVHRPIVLADGSEIGRLVDCAQAKGSRFLEY